MHSQFEDGASLHILDIDEGMENRIEIEGIRRLYEGPHLATILEAHRFQDLQIVIAHHLVKVVNNGYFILRNYYDAQ